jgi:hypothetical protein
MTPERAAELFSLRNPVTRRHIAEASRAWAAFRSPDPREIEVVKSQALPFLDAALKRHLQELPWTTDGLSLLERNILRARAAGATDLLAAVREEPAFLGDTVLAWHVRRLESGKRFPRWLGGYEVKDEKLRWDPALGRVV